MINIYLCEDEEIQRDFVQSMLEMCITEKKIDAKVISAKKRAEFQNIFRTKSKVPKIKAFNLKICTKIKE